MWIIVVVESEVVMIFFVAIDAFYTVAGSSSLCLLPLPRIHGYCRDAIGAKEAQKLATGTFIAQ